MSTAGIASAINGTSTTTPTSTTNSHIGTTGHIFSHGGSNRTSNTSSTRMRMMKKKRREGFSQYYYSYRNYPIEVFLALVMTCVCTIIGIVTFLRIVQQLSPTSSMSSSVGPIAFFNNLQRTRRRWARHRAVEREIALLKKRVPTEEEKKLKEEEEALNLRALPFNSIYRIPESMFTVGDRSNSYVSLRKEYDTVHLPLDYNRSLRALAALYETDHELNLYRNLPLAKQLSRQEQQQQQEQQKRNLNSPQDGPADSSITTTNPYDIYNCPDNPPDGYPYQWNLMDILTAWPTDDVRPPSVLHQGVCVFDYQVKEQYEKALRYREAEVPFVIFNDPELARTIERWHAPGYLERMLGSSAMHITEFSQNNHFLYYYPDKKDSASGGLDRNQRRNKVSEDEVASEGRVEPAKRVRMTYRQWLEHANVTSEDQLRPDKPHYTLRLIACGGMGNDGSCDQASSEYFFDELVLFQPRPSIYIVDPKVQKGIQCRFSMRGVITETHFDASRNMIAVLGGSRRYILAHPNQCSKFALFPELHPAARHSDVDLSNPDLESFPELATAMANEVVLQPGQILYMPSDWLHYVDALTLSFQCNAWSNVTFGNSKFKHDCGF